jgi:hypothetical protein
MFVCVVGDSSFPTQHIAQVLGKGDLGGVVALASLPTRPISPTLLRSLPVLLPLVGYLYQLWYESLRDEVAGGVGVRVDYSDMTTQGACSYFGV